MSESPRAKARLRDPSRLRDQKKRKLQRENEAADLRPDFAKYHLWTIYGRKPDSEERMPDFVNRRPRLLELVEVGLSLKTLSKSGFRFRLKIEDSGVINKREFTIALISGIDF
jgi:hypothetical protein